MRVSLKKPRGPVAAIFDRVSDADRIRITEIAEEIGLAPRLNDPASILSHGQKQWLEIGMLLTQNPRLLLVDEPVAGMTGQETERTAELLGELGYSDDEIAALKEQGIF